MKLYLEPCKHSKVQLCQTPCRDRLKSLRTKRKTIARRSSGFTLVEIMVVLVVIGILAAAIIPQFIGTTQDAKVSTAKANVAELESALGRFYVNMDRYPSSDEGLKALVESPTGD